MVETAAEVTQLRLTHLMRVAHHDLHLQLVDGTLDVGQQLLPSQVQRIHVVGSMRYRVHVVRLQFLQKENWYSQIDLIRKLTIPPDFVTFG